MRYLYGVLFAAILAIAPVSAKVMEDPPVVAGAVAGTPTTTVAPPVVVVQPTSGGEVTTTSTTVVDTGGFVTTLIEWLKVAFGAAVATAIVAVAMKVLTYLGVQTTDAMKAQLQAIVVNGINDGAAKAEAQVGKLAAGGKFSIDVRNQAIADAVAYTQLHGKDLITSMGLDPKSGAAVSAINARIQTAIIDPLTPTNPALSPTDPVIPVVVVAAATKKV